ncbi:predicted protein [Sparassis crispa]|uniref:UvrD-like helicase ATP-binding domain-containing protein n=1 Tax=Sparassis crispa TaxID=139825 RepID=A0A401G935_9APHY|nr:predicted protein [Sparassis crispa]GBE78672.1 predicted protein [Sparassis crispa]
MQAQRDKGRKVRVKLDMSLFDASLLKNEVALEVAVGVLDSNLGNPAMSIEHFIEDLMAIPHLLEFALSVMSDTSTRIFSEWIHRSFPRDPEKFASSVAATLLSRFSLYFHFLPYSATAEEPGNLHEYRRSVQLTGPVLDVLARQTFSEEDDEADEEDAYIVKKRGQQKKRRRAARSTAIDPQIFKNLGLQIPTTKVEAQELAFKILEEQWEILQCYISMFTYPSLREAIRKAYIPPTTLFQDASVTNTEVGEAPSTAAEMKGNEIPAAYPMVQPMKAALYFDSADGFGEWRILISTRADADLRQTRKRDTKLFGIIVKKIKELSNGHFSDDNQKRLTGTETDIPIYEAKMTRDSRLVYQVDCVPEYESDVERQVLKIFGIYTHAQLDKRFWDGVGYQLGRKGKEYKLRCVFRNKPRQSGGNVIMPASFPPPTEGRTLAPSSGWPDLHKDDLEKLHDLLVLEKYVTFSQALLNSILAEQDVAHVFDVSSQEKKIIEHPSSCYVLGRSGTGKTTTMLFKMLGIERSWQAFAETMPKPRQLFVTQSRVLAEKVEEYFSKLHESLATANQSAEELKKTVASKTARHEQGLVDLDEEIDWRGDLPKRFGELQDEHFPMFITFDQLCRLLEAEFGELSGSYGLKNGNLSAMKEDSPEEENNESLSNDYMQQCRAAFVSFGTFMESYWTHFPQSLTKGLDPSLVFGEFMGVIKGSEQTLIGTAGFLEKDAYCGLSHRTQATFANQRDLIYKLFQAYLKRKRERGDYDAADRTHAILNGLRESVPGKQVDFVYIDEAQDNLLIDALVLRTICRNPETGLFWAGDTAQTISVGSAFRFNDLKAFLYRIETNGGTEAMTRTQPESFQLAVNYRSHAGIVNCAHSVIELITRFWPHAIDTLADEKGIIDGLKPVFFSGWDEDSVRYEQFLFGESGSHIEFGAQQCILVRDDRAREKLREQVGDIGLIMTLYESKGLEFNDVLLYNFFQDSTVDLSQWRVILNAMPQDHREKLPAPRFDDARHSGICRELKFLYVAITRARKNLWIADGSGKCEPMRVFWTARDQIQNCSPGTDVPRLAMSSTPEEWKMTALALFNDRRYSQAMHCYERASLPREKAVAHAYYLREQARSTPASTRGDGMTQSKAFTTAAEAFWGSAEEAFLEKRSYFRIAAECYSISGDDGKAAHAYFNASEFTLSAKSYRKAGLFDEAVGVIRVHREAMNQDVVESIIDVSRTIYLRERKLKQARDLFKSDDEALEYMDDYGLDIARATLLEELGRFADAAELHLSEGRTLEAIESFSKDHGNPDSLRRASQCLLDGMWSSLCFGVTPNSELATSNNTLQKLLRLLARLDVTDLDSNMRDEVLMFRAIVSSEFETLLQLGEKFLHVHHDEAAALLCFDRVFGTSLKLQTASLPEIAEQLRSFLFYVQLLQKFANDVDPDNNGVIRRLFGFRSPTQELFLLPKETFLCTQCQMCSTPTWQVTEEGALVPRWVLRTLVRQVLRVERLLRRILVENEACRTARTLQPCLSYVVYGQCHRNDCPQVHTSAASYDAKTYNLRIRIHLQQILIYHTIFAVEDVRQQVRQRRHWLRQLYESLNPPYYKMGSLHILDVAAIPEFEQGLQIVGVWTRDLLQSLNPFVYNFELSKSFMTSLLRLSSLSFSFDPQFAHREIPTIRCVTVRKPRILLRDPGKYYVVPEIVGFLADTHPASLSMGILFANHILEKRVPVDISVLCDFLDHLCGLLVISTRYQQTGTLHEVTLPRSWLMSLARGFKRHGERQTNLLSLYIKPMADLLEQIYTGSNADHLLFESRDFGSLGFAVRQVFILRICKNLCLLGYNVRNEELRRNIVRCITSIRKPGRQFSFMLDAYVRANIWDKLAREIRHSAIGTPLDEMIHLIAANKPQRKPLPGMRQVVYSVMENIPSLLTTTAVLRANAAEFVPAHLATAEPTDNAEDGGEEADDGKEDDVEQAVDFEGVALATQPERSAASAESTEREITAAQAILTIYRQYVRRCAITMSPLGAMRLRIQSAFADKSKELEWPPKSFYRLLFLGPLPHLLVSLECMREHLYFAKKQARRRVSKVAHMELEKAQESVNIQSELLKDAIRLHKALDFPSDLHQRRNVDELKALVLSVEELMSRLPARTTLQWQDDLKLAVKGIVQERRMPAKKPKPELNVEDDFSLEC